MEEKEINAILDKVKVQVGELTKGLVKPEEMESRLKEINASVEKLETTADVITKLNSVVESQGLEIKKLQAPTSVASFKEFIHQSFSAEGIVDKAKEIFANGNGTINVVGKAVGTVTTAQVTTDTGGNAVLDMINSDELNSMRLRDTWIQEYATVTRTSKPVYTYTDYIPKEGDAGFVAEGGTKPQLDLQAAVRSITPNKCAAWTDLTEEAVDDIPRMQSEAGVNIFKKVMLKKQNGILFGDGIGANPTGVTTIAAAFDPLTWPNKEAAGSTNLKDWVVAAANQIQNAENYADDVDYYPNVAFVNPTDYNSLLVKKASTQGQYMFMNIELGSTNQTLGQVAIIAKKEIPVGSILIGDFTKLNIINYVDYFVKMGYINDQLITNEFTMLGETRFYTLVRELDKVAFVYDTFANIQAGIELP